MSEEGVGMGDTAVVRKIPADADENDDSPSMAAWVLLAGLSGLSVLGVWKLVELILLVV